MKNIPFTLLLTGSLLFLLSGCQGTVPRQPVEISVPEQDVSAEKEKAETISPAGPEDRLSEKQVDEVFGTGADASWPDLVRQRFDYYREQAGNWQYLDEKIQSLDLEVEQEGVWRRCGDLYSQMIDNYEDVLVKTGREDNQVFDNRSLWNLLAEDFRYLGPPAYAPEQFFSESGSGTGRKECQRFLVDRASAVVKHHAARRQYGDAIRAYRFMKMLVDREKIPADIKEIYGQALVEQGRLREALDVFMDILAGDGERLLKSLTLRRETVRYIIALGDFNRARLQIEEIDEISGFCCEAGRTGKDYEKLLGDSTDTELELYGEALRSWLVSGRQEIPPVLRENVNELRQRFPDSEAARMGAVLLEQVEARVERHVYRELSRAVEMVKENDFRQALQIVHSLNQASLPQETEQKVKETETAILKKQAQEEARQERLRKEALTAKWEKAVGFLDRKEYDKALEYFRSLLNTRYRQEARDKISETIRLAATAKRQKAAELFIRARDTRDMDRKIELLQQSRQLLLEIMKKYPEAEVIDKVGKNLEVVEEAMREVEPGLLNE